MIRTLIRLAFLLAIAFVLFALLGAALEAHPVFVVVALIAAPFICWKLLTSAEDAKR